MVHSPSWYYGITFHELGHTCNAVDIFHTIYIEDGKIVPIGTLTKAQICFFPHPVAYRGTSSVH